MSFPSTSTLLVLLSGFLLSVIALFVASPICDGVEKRELASASRGHIAKVAGDLQDKLNLVESFAAQLSGDAPISQTTFSAAAESVIDTPGIYSVEWAPKVVPQRRSEAEAILHKMAGKDVAVMTYRDGRTIVVPADEEIRPITYVEPATENTLKHIGFQRGSWAGYVFAMQIPERAFLVVANRWYHADDVRRAVFAAVRDSDGEIRGSVFATLEDLFEPSISQREPIVVTATDITTPDYAVHSPKNKQHLQLCVIESTPVHFAAQQQIGGRLFEFSARANSYAEFRPVWIPWTLFFLINLAACLLGLRRYQYESKKLALRNEALQREISRRIALQRHLQATLDFRDQERELVAHDIHDGFVQDVIGAQMFVEATLAEIPLDGGDRLRERSQTVADLLGHVIEEARKTIDYLKPRVVDEVGLIPAIEASIDDDLKNYGFTTKFVYTSDFPRMPLLAERIIYRMIREAICNARQHSGEDSASICMSTRDGCIVAEITDTGCGFDKTKIENDRFGLSGLHQRAQVLNGNVVTRTSEFGTKIEIEVPIEQAEIPSLLKNESLLLEA